MEFTDDVVYSLILIFSVPLGLLVKPVSSPELKKVVCTVVGLVVALITIGGHIIHVVVVTIVSIVIIRVVGPRKCHFCTFVWCFGYLAFFRTCHYFGIPKVSPLSNAVQLFVTLRVVGLGFEIHDSCSELSTKDDLDEEKELWREYKYISPSAVDMFQYSFCYIGQFTGPYYKYRTYHDMVNTTSIANIPSIQEMLRRIKDVPLIGIAYIFFSYFFNITYTQTEEFYDNPFWFRLFYMMPMFIIFRTRLYMAWILSECMCMTIGLGAYPRASKPKCGQGPTDLKEYHKCMKSEKPTEYDYETIHNLSIYGCELGRTTKEGLRSWNMTVQYWLAAYCHRRIPNSLKAYRVAITMTISAFWHGIYPGYYLSFLLVPVILLAEDSMISAFRRGSHTQQKWFDWACWFFKMRGFDYMCMGFLLLRLDYTLTYWKSVYFIGHCVTVLFLITGTLCRSKSMDKKS
ncbi:lysophospholipid acyltransferase 7-like isoform X2 [Ostrea edulis]|uniref:lysophospholipid acyltransferase 7-like isoform X2 n=1 Tax=Ostrea edulis TaxID=37623 RepID=UPI0024AE8A87|nr:lysophospholipid acyltransferase 7-like isoform X2 [Ostrea edulis]